MEIHIKPKAHKTDGDEGMASSSTKRISDRDGVNGLQDEEKDVHNTSVKSQRLKVRI